MNVGDYARLKNGEIVKLVDVNIYYVLGENAKNVYSCIISKNNDFPSLVHNDFIVRKGKIIDLAEVGDYVNGEKVRYIKKEKDWCYLSIDDECDYVIAGYDSDGCTKPLKSIVTHEQFSQMEYKAND